MQRGGRGGGGFRGGGRSFGGGGRGGGRSFGGGRGGGRGFQDYGPPSEVIEAGIFEHPCEGEAVCKLSIDKVIVVCFSHVAIKESTQLAWATLSSQFPNTGLLQLTSCSSNACITYAIFMQVPYFNAPMFLQNKTQVGRIEEIFGGITNTVRPLAVDLSRKLVTMHQLKFMLSPAVGAASCQ